jgi:hypothetical protein
LSFPLLLLLLLLLRRRLRVLLLLPAAVISVYDVRIMLALTFAMGLPVQLRFKKML